MFRDIISAQPIAPHQLYLCFEDGVEGTIDIAKIITFFDIFAPLKDPDYFATVQVNPEIGTVMWENCADLDPDLLYAIVSQTDIPDYPALQLISN